MEKLTASMGQTTALLMCQLELANADAERLRQIENGEIEVPKAELRELRKRVIPLVDRTEAAADLATAIAALVRLNSPQGEKPN